MKVIAATARYHPLMNAVVSISIFGIKVFVQDELSMRFAVEKTYEGETFVRDVEKKSIQTIASEIRTIAELPYEELPGIKPVLFFHRYPYSVCSP